MRLLPAVGPRQVASEPGRRAVPWALFLGLTAAGVSPVFEGDLFWHLATGRWIVAERAIPRSDPFRFTSPEGPWVDHEWLFQVLVHLAERAVGLQGLALLSAVALGLFSVLLYRRARTTGLAPGLAGLLALGCAMGARPRFLVRPEVPTLFAVVTLLWLLDRYRHERGRALVASVALLTVVWVNLHGAALLAPALAGLLLAGEALRQRSGRLDGSAPRGPVGVREALGIPGLLAGLLLANPYGWRLLEVPVGIAEAMRDLPADNPEWMTALEAPQPYLFAAFAVAAALALAAARQTRHGPDAALLLPALFTAALALTAVRHQALFFATILPLAARSLASLQARGTLSHRQRQALAGLALVAVTAATAWAVSPPASGPLRARHGGLRWGWGLAPGRFPERFAEVLQRRPQTGPLFNELVAGGFLLWKLHPPRRVFLDGRMELDPGLLRRIAAARRSAEEWDRFLRENGATGALVRYDARPRPVFEPDGRGGLVRAGEGTANTLLFPPDRWDLVDWDDFGMLFLRRGAHDWPSAPFVAVQPEDPRTTLVRAASDAGLREQAIAEVERLLAAQPDCRRAAWLSGQLRALRSGAREAGSGQASGGAPAPE